MQLEVYDASCSQLIVKGVVKDVTFNILSPDLVVVRLLGAGFAHCCNSESCGSPVIDAERYLHPLKSKINS